MKLSKNKWIFRYGYINKPIFKKYSAFEAAAVFSALSLQPAYQSNLCRLEKAVHYCLSFCKGKLKPDPKFINKLFLLMEQQGIASMEDPAENVLTSNLWLSDKSYQCQQLSLA